MPTGLDGCFLREVHSATHYCPLCGTATYGGMCPSHGVAGVTPGGVDPGQVFVPGAVLGGRYRIEHVLGVFGSQATFLAQSSQGPVILEALGVERLARRARLLDGLFQEAEVLRLFQRPGMVQIVDFGVEPVTQNPFLVMAYTVGRNLHDVIAPASAEKQTAAAFVEVCHGLLNTHDREVLDPANAMPTQVPGALATQVPQYSQPVAPLLRPPAPAPVPAPPEASSWAGSTGWKWLAASCVVGIGIYASIPDPMKSARYYNPQITEKMEFYHGQGGQADLRSFQSSAGGAEGSVDLGSNPPGATVWLGSQILGETPVSLPRPGGGERLRVILKRQGYLDKAVVIHQDTDQDFTVELYETPGGEASDPFVGEAKTDDPLVNPFQPKDYAERFGKNPMTETPFLNPFGQPGTAPRVVVEPAPTYIDDDDDE